MSPNNSIDEEDYGGHGEFLQEGLPGWVGSFLVSKHLIAAASAAVWQQEQQQQHIYNRHSRHRRPGVREDMSMHSSKARRLL